MMPRFFHAVLSASLLVSASIPFNTFAGNVEAAEAMRRMEHLMDSIRSFEAGGFSDLSKRSLKEADGLSAALVELSPTNHLAWLHRATVLQMNGRLSAALEAVSMAIKIEPTSPYLFRQKAQILAAQDRLSEALAAAEQGVNITPADGYSVKRTMLEKCRILLLMNRYTEAGVVNCNALGFPLRDARNQPNLIDLSPFYNGALGGWTPGMKRKPNSDGGLMGLKPGLHTFNDVPFDVRGVVQLNGTRIHEWTEDFPEKVTGIRVDQKLRRLNFLHGSDAVGADTEVIGRYIVRFENGSAAEIPIRYGEDVRDLYVRNDPIPATRAAVAWSGQNRRAAVRLFQTSWKNSKPELVVRSMDFISTMGWCAPVLVAVTAE